MKKRRVVLFVIYFVVAILAITIMLFEQKSTSDLGVDFEKILKNKLEREPFNKKIITQVNSKSYKELINFIEANKDTLLNTTQEIIVLRKNRPDLVYDEPVQKFELFISSGYSDDSIKIPKPLKFEFSKIKKHLLELYNEGIQIELQKNGQINIIFPKIGNINNQNTEVITTHQLIFYDSIKNREDSYSKDSMLQGNIKYNINVMKHVD